MDMNASMYKSSWFVRLVAVIVVTVISSHALKIEDYDVNEDLDSLTAGGVRGRAGGGPARSFTIVCPYTNWAAYRTDLGKFLPEDIDPTLCTDIVYDYATLDPKSLTITVRDQALDIQDNFYQRVLSLKSKNPSLRVFLSVGGWSDSGDDRFSRLVASRLRRSSFIIQAVLLLQKFGFDGLELAWISPVCWQGNCDAGPANDRENFAEFLKEIRAAFDRQNPPLKLSATVSGMKQVIEKAYDVPTLASTLDRIDVMTYDFTGHWDGKTGHQAPLHSPGGEGLWTVISALEFYVTKGAPKEKLVMGVPAYGRTFKLDNPGNTGVGSPSTQPGIKGEIFGEEGRLAYYEICDRVKRRGWSEKEDKKSVGNFAYKDDQWVSFDGPILAAKKAKYVRQKGYGGITLWDLSADDFRGTCCLVKYPLLSSINFILRGKGAHPEKLGCNANTGVTSANAVTVPPPGGSVILPKDDPSKGKSDFKVVCSFTAWASYRQGIHKFAPEDISAELCTDIVYDYAILDSETLTMVVKDVSSDIDDELYQRVLDLKTRNPRLRVHLSLGGWADSEGNKFSRLVSSLSTRQRFVANAVEFLKKYKFDGLDVAWMFPVCWQTNCQAGSVQDRQNFADFIQELRYAFDRENPRLYLSITVSGSRDIINRAYQIEKMIGSLDRVDLMSYDLAGHWFGKTGHHAPLYIPAGKETPKWSVNDAVQLLLRKGVPPNKLVLGIPTYGIGFTLASSTDHKIGARVTGPSTSSEVFGNEGRFAFYELCERVKNRGWTKITDPAIGPYVYKGNEWVGYDDVESAATKAKYIKLNKLGGATIWDVTLDDFNAHCCDVKNPLLNAVSYILNGRGKPPKDLGCEPSGISPDPAERLDPRLPA